MRPRYVLWWGLRAAIVVAALALAITWQAYGPVGPGVVHAGTWEGDWKASTGHWVGTVTWQFDDSGDEKWTEAEKKVVREAAAEWERLGDSSVDLEEVKEGADLKLKWKDPGLGGHVGGAFTPLPIGTNQAPNGVSFNPNATAGWYVDPDPTTDEAIPGGKWDLLSVAKHELGHTLGLKHSNPPPPEAMDTAGGFGRRQHLTESDHKAIAKLYPVSQPNNCSSCQDMTFPVGGVGMGTVIIQFDFDMTPVDWLRADCLLAGLVEVVHGNPMMDTDGHHVATEILSMDLTGTCNLDGPVQVNVRLNPTFPSIGVIMDDNPDPLSHYPAYKRFDTYFQIDMEAFGQTFPHRTQDPLTFWGTIDGIPPYGAEFAPWGGGEYQVAGTGTGPAGAALQDEDSTCDPQDPIAIPIFSAVDPSLVAGFICDAVLTLEPPQLYQRPQGG